MNDFVEKTNRVDSENLGDEEIVRKMKVVLGYFEKIDLFSRREIDEQLSSALISYYKRVDKKFAMIKIHNSGVSRVSFFYHRSIIFLLQTSVFQHPMISNLIRLVSLVASLYIYCNSWLKHVFTVIWSSARLTLLIWSDAIKVVVNRAFV